MSKATSGTAARLKTMVPHFGLRSCRLILKIAGGTPEAARDFLAGETARLEPVIRKAKITAE